MKKNIILLCLSYIFFIHQSNAQLTDEFIIEYNGKEYTYENFWNEMYGEKGGYSQEVYDVGFIELKRVISKIKELKQNITPEKRIEIFKYQLRLPELVYNFGCCGGWDYLLKVNDDLRSIGYPIADDELELFNYTNFYRQIPPYDLVKLVKEYPDTDYEKEALYLIATETIYGASFREGPGMLSLKNLLLIIQSSNLFIEKYPNDPRVEEVRNRFEELKQIYNENGENYFQDEMIEKQTEYILGNNKICTGEEEEEGCEDIFSHIFKETYKIKKKPLEEILKDPLGYYETVEVKEKETTSETSSNNTTTPPQTTQTIDTPSSENTTESQNIEAEETNTNTGSTEISETNTEIMLEITSSGITKNQGSGETVSDDSTGSTVENNTETISDNQTTPENNNKYYYLVLLLVVIILFLVGKKFYKAK